MDTESTPIESAPATEMSLPSRLANVFTAPGEVFDAVKSKPVANVNWLVPAILFIVLSWISAVIVFSQDSVKQQMDAMTDKAFERQVANGKMTQEQADKGRETALKIARIATKIGAVAVPVLLAFASPFWWGLLLWLAGSKALQGGFTYMKAVELAGLANIILALDVIVRTPLIVMTGSLFAAPSLSLLVKDFDPQNSLHGLLAMANATVVWILIVRSIGLARFSRVSMAKAALWVFGMWFVQTATLFGFGQSMKAIGKAAGGG